MLSLPECAELVVPPTFPSSEQCMLSYVQPVIISTTMHLLTCCIVQVKDIHHWTIKHSHMRHMSHPAIPGLRTACKICIQPMFFWVWVMQNLA